MAPKRKRVEKESGAAGSSTDPAPAPRALKRRDTDSQVQRILDESFSDFGANEVDGVLVEGKTLRGTLAEMKRTKRLVQGRLSVNMRQHLK
eukprot:4028573-Amphidinium_carterae.1